MRAIKWIWDQHRLVFWRYIDSTCPGQHVKSYRYWRNSCVPHQQAYPTPLDSRSRWCQIVFLHTTHPWLYTTSDGLYDFIQVTLARHILCKSSKARKKEKKKERKLWCCHWCELMTSLHFSVGLSLYVIPKWALQELECLLSKVNTLNMHRQDSWHLSLPRASS